MKEIEQIARASYGKLLAIISKETAGDIASAEDFLGSALAKALEHWPRTGLPRNPEGWLVQTARNENRDRFRREKSKAEHERQVLESLGPEPESLVDRRLELLFACAHPAIDPEARTPLMLQTVLGLSADRIAAAFLISPSAMEKRLARAKTKIKQARVPLEVPGPDELEPRLNEVMDAVYAAFGSAWEGLEPKMASESIFLARVLVDLLADQAEPKGLLSLMLFCESRSQARRVNGQYMPLDRQDGERWDRAAIVEAESWLLAASAMGRPGRFQLEAAIQSAHADRVLNKNRNDAHVLTLYRGLLAIAPSVGAYVGFGAALLAAGDLAGASRAVSELEKAKVDGYQPFWVLRAHVLEREGRIPEAVESCRAALRLTADPSIAAFLSTKLDGLLAAASGLGRASEARRA